MKTVTALLNFAKLQAYGLRLFFDKERETLSSFPFFLFFAVLLHFTALATFSISIDDEQGALRTLHEVWIEQGRWTNYLFQTFLLPNTTVPYLPNLLLVFFVTLAYLFFIKVFDLKINFYTYALFPIFCAFPTWAFIGEFYANLAVTGLGVLLISLAACHFRWTIVEPIIKSEKIQYQQLSYLLFFQSLLVATAVGIYQTLFFAFASMCLSIMVFIILTKKVSFHEIFRALALLALLLLTSLIVYYIIQSLALFLTGLNTSYVNNFISTALFDAPFSTLRKALSKMNSVYMGAASLYGTSLSAMGFLLLLGMCTIIFAKQFSGNFKLKIIIFGLAIATLIFPFALDVLGGGHMPLRSLLGVPYVLWFFALLASMNSQKLIRGLAVLLLIIGTFQILYATSLYSASAQLTLKHDELLAASIYQRIAEANPNFDREKSYQIYFFGAKPMVSIYPNVPTTTMAASFFSWDEGNPYRMINFMKLLGFNNLQKLDTSQYNKFTSYIEAMPIWPSLGSVKMVDDVTLVKLGNTGSNI
jgi:hypothetical protein